MNYQLSDIAKIIGAEAILNFGPVEITQVSFDTRKPIQGSNTLFIALTGPNTDGHRFVNSAYQKGCRSFLVERMQDDFPKGANYLIFENVLKGIQEVATHFREDYQGVVLGITGSTGKTTIKEWLYEILHTEKAISKSPKSFNSQLGVALSTLLISKNSELAILEAGISEPGEMDALQRIIQPNIGLFSNIGDAHQANFETREQKVIEKLKLFKNAEQLLYCRDHELVHKQVQWHFKGKTQTWGRHETSDLKVVRRDDARLVLEYGGRTLKVKLSDSDNYHYENVMHCILFCLVIGMDAAFIESTVKGLSPMNMRLEMRHGVDQILLVNDSYSADFQSLAVALDYLKSVSGRQKKTLVLSDFADQRFLVDEYVHHLNQLIVAYGVDRMVGVGPWIQSVGTKLVVGEKAFFENTEEFLAQTTPKMFHGEAILVKGARKFRMERVVHFFQAKSHRTRLEVNMSALRYNFNWFKNRLPPGTHMMVMVKALSYGAGSFEVARLLEELGAKYLAVAYTDEGVALRTRGITRPIMVLNPEGEGFVNLVHHRLEPEVYSFSMLESLITFLKQEGVEEPLSIHINFDTGMHRLGFHPSEVNALIALLKENDAWVKIASVFTHLAASDDLKHDLFTKSQLSLTKDLSEELKKGLNQPFLVHACNTGGAINYASSCFDMVRLGIGFYGVDPFIQQNDLMPSLRLVTQVSQVKTIEKGESVGYGRRWVASVPAQTATIPIGYADGLPRAAGNGNAVAYINGVAVPFVGSICMDMSIIDVTNIEVKEGDEVIIFETQSQLQKLSEDLGTISYEVLSRISHRVKRVFIEE